MNLTEWNAIVYRNEILRKLLPLEVRKTYPYFSLHGSELHVSYVGFLTRREGNSLKAFSPVYFLKLACPQCTLLSYEALEAPASDEGILMQTNNREQVQLLSERANAVLTSFEKHADTLPELISEYNALLESLLEENQLCVLKKYQDE